jgi:hypothetical protein
MSYGPARLGMGRAFYSIPAYPWNFRHILEVRACE